MVNVMQYNIDSIIRSKPAWIFYLLLIQALIAIMTIKGMQFVFKKGSSIFVWKIKDRPKHWKTFDLIAKVIITSGLAFLVVTYMLPFVLDIPCLLTGTEERATVVVVSGMTTGKRMRLFYPLW